MRERPPEKIEAPDSREKLIERFLAFEPPHFVSDSVGTLGSEEIAMLPDNFSEFFETDHGDDRVEDMKTRWIRREASNAEIAELAELYADFKLADKGKVIHGRFQDFQKAQKEELRRAA